MIIGLQQQLRRHVEALIQRLYRLDAPPPVVIEYPPSRSLGDLSMTIAFELARRLRRPPRAIAAELAEQFGSLPAGVRAVQAVPTGYLNVYLDRESFLRERLQPPPARDDRQGHGKTIVEHTAINPNKAAHIGHLRNAALGDTLVRLLRFQDVPVEVQNYIDDTGVQVADVVVGFQEIEKKDLASIQRLAENGKFDYYCWDLYSRVTAWYEEDRDRLRIRARALHEIEQGQNDTAAMAAFIADRVVRRHLSTMARLGVCYDLLTWESDILRLRFWHRAFEILKQSGTVFLQTEGKLAGCWVMPIKEDGAGGETTDEAVDEEGDAREKVIVRSDGTVTYVGKDIAYQYWKFGLLDREFEYRIYQRTEGDHTIWATSTDPPPPGVVPPSFGHAETTYNVIDVRQSYLQRLLKQALVTLGHTREAERSVHFSYEMVALSPQTAKELGYTDDADRSRSFVEVSGRRGQGVKADDLLDALVEKAHREVVKRNPELPRADQQAIAQEIASAAVRYFMLKYSRNRIIAFDIDEALSFEGESGPYLQYSVVRANNIFAKLNERHGLTEHDIENALLAYPATALQAGDEGDELWSLILESARLDEIVAQVIRTLEFSSLAKYALSLAQLFNAYYHRYQILREERQDVRVWRAAGIIYFRRQLTRALALMGLAVPSRM